jgi:thiol-disulfide isomerase/thioredoxin
MKKIMLWFSLVLFSAFGSLVLAAPAFADSAPLMELSLGQDKIDFADYRGKVILLDFWASWCGPCRQSFPWMNEMQARYGEQGLVVLAVNLDQDKQDAEAFLNDVPAEFVIAYDPSGSSAEKMEVMGMPMSYLIDRNGKVQHRLIGFNSQKKSEHEKHIRSLLNQLAK